MKGKSSYWTKEEIEKIVIWLEDSANRRRKQKGSGEIKKRGISTIASTISSRLEAHIGYHFDNLKKSYREAVRLANQSGWGLNEEDLKAIEKLKRMCPFFTCLDAIWGSHPNIRPSSLFSSSTEH